MKDLLHVRYFFHILLALTSSFLLILAWFLGEFFLFIGFIPLFILIRSIKTSRNYFQIFLYSYITFSVWNFALVYWLTYISFSGGLVVIIANAFLMALVPVLAIFTDDYSNKNIITSSFLIYWILFEYLHQHWFLAFPWLHLGNAFASLPSWIQWYEYTGVLGGSVWILVTNLLIYKGLYFHRHNFLYAFLWFLLPFLFSLYQF